MKKALLILASLGAAGIVYSAATATLIPIWNGSGYTFATLGPTLILKPAAATLPAQLDALIPPSIPGPAGPQGEVGPVGPAGPAGAPGAGATPRHYDVLLTWDGVGGWNLPAGAQNITVTCNGLRYRPNVDYAIVGGTLKPLAGNMDSSFVVTIDYD